MYRGSGKVVSHPRRTGSVAVEPVFQHVVTTYASEANNTAREDQPDPNDPAASTRLVGTGKAGA